MTKAKPAVAVLAAVSWLSLAAPSGAQITTAVDAYGKLVFVNADSRAGRNGSTISSQSRLEASSADSRMSSARPAWPPLPAPTAPSSEGGLPAGAPPAPQDQPAQPEGRLDRIVREAAERNNLDPALVKAVISTESGWNPNAISRKGAVGLMQLIPGTAQRYGVNNSFDPAQNVEGGTKYLKSLLDRYNGDLTKSLAAYNAGERTVDLNRGVPAIPETQRYIQKVTNAYFQPGSSRNRNLWIPPKPLVRREIDSTGRVVFTNE
jgi:soluble lytic murein transglycosylase-like protein